MNNTNPSALFPLGNCYMTPGVMDLVERFQFPASEFLARHQVGDPGILVAEDVEANLEAVKNGSRIVSVFMFTPEPNVSIKLWIITEADRSSTTILLPEEYWQLASDSPVFSLHKNGFPHL